MHILYILNEFPKLSESFILNEIHGLGQVGHEVTIISLRKPAEDVAHQELDSLDADVRYLPEPGIASGIHALRKQPKSRIFSQHLNILTPSELAGVAYIGPHLKHEVERLNRDPAHIHMHFLDWPKFAVDYIQLDVPVTITAHAFDIFSQGSDSQRKALTKRVDKLITISDYNRRALENKVNASNGIDVVHMGVSSQKFKPSSGAIHGRLLTVARFVEKKGIEYAIDAVARLVAEFPQIRYHIIGDGPCVHAIRNRVKRRGVSDHVALLGQVSDERLINELDEAMAFILPSVIASDGDRDGVPIALMEAMAMETVPITSAVSGIPELVTHRETGLLCEPRDVRQLSKMIETVVVDESARQKMASLARSAIKENFSVKNQIQAMDSVIHRLA